MKISHYVKLIKHIYRISPWHVIASDISLLLATAVEMWAIGVGGQFIDALAIYLQENESFDFVDFFYSDAFFYLISVLLLAIFAIILNNIRNYLTEYINRHSSFNAWSIMYDKLASENLDEIESKKFQDILAFVTSYSIDSLTQAYRSFAEALRHLIRGLSALIIMISQLGWTPLLIVLFVFPQAFRDYMKRVEQGNFRNDRIEIIKLAKYLEQFSLDMNNFLEMKVNRIINYIKNEYNNVSGDFMKKSLDMIKSQQVENVLYGVIGLVLTRAYYVFLIFLGVTLKLSIGTLSALFGYATTVYDSFLGFFNNLFTFLNNYVYFSKFFELEEYEGFSDNKLGEIRLKEGAPDLEMIKVDYKYPERDEKSLVNITLNIKKGEKVAIIGGDSSGKSTLIKLLCSLYPVTDGDYLINGNRVQDLKRGELKNRIAIVNQDFNKYYFTVKRNIVITKNPDRVNREMYEKVKKICGIDKFMKRINLRDDQVLGKIFMSGREISPGLWQRIAIARALYRNKDILLLDEPFTFIDEESRHTILKNILKFLGKEKSLIYVSQSSENTEVFDKVYYLKLGRLIQVK